LELSTAIKCPNINYHLCGTKKVQQVLAQPGVVERFLSEKEALIIRQCFAGLYSLDKGDSDKVRRVVVLDDLGGVYLTFPGLFFSRSFQRFWKILAST